MDDRHSTEPPEDPLGDALEAVTSRMARRLNVRVDRLLAQVADLAELEARIAALTAELEEPEP
jgi:hypothetical protein